MLPSGSCTSRVPFQLSSSIDPRALSSLPLHPHTAEAEGGGGEVQTQHQRKEGEGQTQQTTRGKGRGEEREEKKRGNECVCQCANLMVPEPSRSPGRMLHPVTEWCTSCCRTFQYRWRKLLVLMGWGAARVSVLTHTSDTHSMHSVSMERGQRGSRVDGSLSQRGREGEGEVEGGEEEVEVEVD